MKFFAKNEDKNAKKLSWILLNWYQKNKRDLPWRKTKDSYAILVSEIMLQQTQVNTVIPYYYRWLNRWPDWASLASSNEEDVIKLWEGLGYYSRARALRSIAQLLVRNGTSSLPQNIKDLRKLPGIGEYTAGAVASIAFGIRAAAVDGNVRRVIGRLIGLDCNTNPKQQRRKIQETLDFILPQETRLCGDFNQALMELGALICKPRDPQCGACPWRNSCVFFSRKDRFRMAVNVPKKNKKHVEIWAWIQRGGRLWCKAPTASRLLQGLWTLPQFDPEKMSEIRKLGELKFTISNRRVHATILQSDWKNHQDNQCEGSWLSVHEINQRPFSAAARKFIAKMGWTA
jgi:A/G-specific adenine glycosylase